MSRLFQNFNSDLESALTSIEELNDGGATKAQMVQALTDLALIETQIKVAQSLTLSSEIQGEIKIDAARQLSVLRKEGTAMINRLAFPLSMRPCQRYFYPAPLDSSMDFYLHGDAPFRGF